MYLHDFRTCLEENVHISYSLNSLKGLQGLFRGPLFMGVMKGDT